MPPAIQVLAFAAVLAAALLVNLSTLGFGFLPSWDDHIYVVDNPWIRGFTRENLVHAFSEPYYANFLPLHLVSYMIDYSIWGLKPFGYHLQSVLLNALNAALALWVVHRLLGNFCLAFLAALLFAVHPSHVEAVAWVSIRKDLLSTTFLLLTVHCYLRATDDGALRRGPYVASVVCFTLGLLSKLSIVALPLFLLLVDALPQADRRQISWKVSHREQAPLRSHRALAGASQSGGAGEYTGGLRTGAACLPHGQGQCRLEVPWTPDRYPGGETHL